MSNIKIPESIQNDVRQRQNIMAQLNNEIQLILKTFMATVENDKVYQLSEDLTELIEVTEEEKEDGESIS